jgi:hypothetical protein
MSVLETPRVYFNGEVVWDPIVTNNQSAFYNEDTSETVFPDALNKVAAFRAEAINAVNLPKQLWNPDGTHRSSFYNAYITGADLGGGVVQDDPFVGSPANFLGMLVDLEPYGTFTSQLFFDGMRFGIDGGYRIALRRNSRYTSRYINFYRNSFGWRAGIASVVWQTCFAKGDGLRIDAFDSPALQALQKALDGDGVLGLTVQWNAYRTIYFNDPNAATNAQIAVHGKQLVDQLNGGGFQPNPARSSIVGVIGLWREGEPVNEPCDRTLVVGPGAPQKPPTIVTAHARVAADAITIDLSNSISEDGSNMVKHDFGDLSVVALDGSGNPTTLGTFGYAQYDTDAYLQTSGIVTVPITGGAAAAGDLQIRDAQGNVLLTEAALRALPLVPNLYINSGDTVKTSFQVYDRGVPAGAGIQVTVYKMSADSSTLEGTATYNTIADGTISFDVTGTAGIINVYVAVPGPNPTPPPPDQGLDPELNTFMYVRVLPADDDVAKLPPTWANVYSRVLANWHAMAPCMDNWLDLGSEAQVRSFAPLLKKLTKEAAFEHFRYMPVTRDLTRGARTLLYNFLNSPPAAKVAAEMMKAEAEPEQPTLTKLSRKMRA